MPAGDSSDSTTLDRPRADAPPISGSKITSLASRGDRLAGTAFVLPAILVILFLSILPLILSLWISLTRLTFEKGGATLTFVGLDNYDKLLRGINRVDFLGLLVEPTPLVWFIMAVVMILFLWWLYRYARGQGFSIGGLIFRLVVAFLVLGAVWLTVRGLETGGRPGTLEVTWIYVFVGITVQYLLGLGLALLCAQHIPGRRFFRVVFLLPMMITPVGIAYLFRMLTDTQKGPFYPIWAALGLVNTSWVTDPWGARIAVMIGDTWQWTPFMFIVLLAALESLPTEPVEAAVVDGAGGWDIFRHITFPAILPVTTTVVLIRMIEAFKIIDLPNILTNGGPGTATESLTLHAYFIWRALDIGGSAAVAYLLLFVVTFAGIAYVTLIRRPVEQMLE
jgi:multiple sugar transport system permease protein